jgi:hypothetical protein
MNTVLRFKSYLDTKGIKNAQAERDCGLSNGLIKSAISAGSALGSDKLEKILITYPDLSAEWLLRGSGNMLVGDGLNHEQVFKALNMPSNSDKIIEVWMEFMKVTKGMQELYKQSK